MFTLGRDNLKVVAMVAVLAFIFAALTIVSWGDWSPIWRFVVMVIGAHIPYVIALFTLAKRSSISPVFLVSAALFLRLLLVFGMPTFSDDVYRYVWDGMVTLDGTNPYAHAPDDPALAHLRDDGWKKINNKELRTIYPPGAQYIFAVVAAVSPSIYFFKFVAALADTGLVIMILLLIGGVRRQDGILAAAAYGLNPLACVEVGMSGHLEPLAILPLLLAIYFLKSSKYTVTAAFAALAATVKLLPLTAILVLGRRKKIVWLAALAFAILFCLPFFAQKQNLLETLDAFGRRWEFNAGLFEIIKGIVYAVTSWFSNGAGPNDLVYLPFMDSPARMLQGTFFSLHKDGGFDIAHPGAFGRLDLSLAITKLIMTFAIGFVALLVFVKKFVPIRFCLFLFGAVIVFTPVLHPWYLLWVLPFAAIQRAWPWFVFGATLPLAYLTLDGWWAHGEWNLPCWVQFIEWGTLLIATVAFRVDCSTGNDR